MGVPGSERFVAYTFLVIGLADLATSAGLVLVERDRKQADAAAPVVN
jgi:hypothetical protein